MVPRRTAGSGRRAPTVLGSAVIDDYLQVIHYMQRDGLHVIAARLAERLRVTPPTVTATLQRMERDGLIRHGPRKEIRFTVHGREVAEDIVRRHALAEHILTDLLKLPWHQAHEESHGFEHAITPKIERHLMRVLGHPTTCPHGNPIPGLGSVSVEEFPLDRVHSGEEIVLQRITEEAEEDPELMRYLQEHGVAPGAHLKVREATRFNALIVLESELGTVALGYPVAAKLRAIRIGPRASGAVIGEDIKGDNLAADGQRH